MNPPSSIERLEARIAPANVIATLSGGILKLVSPDADVEADFQLRQTGANSFALVETVAGVEEQTHFTGVKAIKATLTPLGDHAGIVLNWELPVFRGSISVDGVAGSDSLSVTGGGVLAGDLTMKTKGAGGSFTIEATVRGKAKISSSGGGAEIFGPLGSLTATGFNNLEFNDTADIRGSVKITAGPLTDMNVSANGGHFRGDVTIIGSAADDSVYVGGHVDGKLSVKLGGGENSFRTGENPYVGAKLFGAVSYSGGSGSDHLLIGPAVTLGSALKVSAGDGDNSLTILAAGDLASLTYRGGAGSDSFTLAEAGGEFLRARIDLGDGFDQATVRNTNVLDLRLDGGANPPWESGDADVLRAVAGIAGMTVRRFETIQTIT